MRGPAATPAGDSPVWLRLLALETVIENAPQGAAAARTPIGVDRSGGVAAAVVAEEKLYDGAVRDPNTENILTDAAAQTGDAAAISAVATDLAIVHASLVSQAAAGEAQSTLALLDSLSSTQCTATTAVRALIWPVEGRISQQFGPSDLSLEPSRWVAGVWYPHYHTGLDIAGPVGTPVRAAAGGLVIVASSETTASGQLVGYGQYIVIKHADGCATLYGHLLDMTVHSGDSVIQGDIIGHEGSTGSSTGPHLHFEVRVKGDPVDPMRYLA
jgi:murein DD-endopeptidase MepM/ murein hydrolase activator NlpD